MQLKGFYLEDTPTAVTTQEKNAVFHILILCIQTEEINESLQMAMRIAKPLSKGLKRGEKQENALLYIWDQFLPTLTLS